MTLTPEKMTIEQADKALEMHMRFCKINPGAWRDHKTGKRKNQAVTKYRTRIERLAARVF